MSKRRPEREFQHLPTGALVGSIRFEASVDEIYDLEILPGYTRPGILNTEGETFRCALTTPDATFWAVENQH